MKSVKCDTCPILNRDEVLPPSCNLKYLIRWSQSHVRGEAWISDDCKLEVIFFEGLEFRPIREGTPLSRGHLRVAGIVVILVAVLIIRIAIQLVNDDVLLGLLFLIPGGMGAILGIDLVYTSTRP